MPSVTTPVLMTAEEFGQLDEVLGFRDELIEGERALSPSAIFAHTRLIKLLEKLLEAQLSTVSNEPLEVVREGGWRFRMSGADNVPVPDLMIIRTEDGSRAMQSRGWFEGVPVLVVEIVSPSERNGRRLQKIGLYLDMGVPHVVEVDYSRRVVRLHSPEADSAVVYREGDQLVTPFQAIVGEIFAILD